MSVISFLRDFSNLFNYPSEENPTTQQDYQNAVRNWVTTETSLVDTILWQPSTQYTVGNIVKTPSLPSQCILVCTVGGESGSTEPDYTNVNVGGSVTDGMVTWLVTEQSHANRIGNVVTYNAADVIDLTDSDTTEVSGTFKVIGGSLVVVNITLKITQISGTDNQTVNYTGGRIRESALIPTWLDGNSPSIVFPSTGGWGAFMYYQNVGVMSITVVAHKTTYVASGRVKAYGGVYLL